MIWLYPHVAENNEKYLELIASINSFVNNLIVFANINECIKWIEANDKEDIILLISGNVPEFVIKRLDDMPAVDSIFLFHVCGIDEQNLMKEKKSIRGVFKDTNKLIDLLKKEAETLDERGISMSFLSRNDMSRDINALDPSFIYTKLIREIILEMKYTREDRTRFLAYGKKTQMWDDTDQSSVEDFANNYPQKNPITWYSEHSPVFRILNHALRHQQFEHLIHLGFFISDLHKNLVDLQSKASQEQRPKLTLFRGQKILRHQLERFKNSIGGIYSFNEFLSTSKEKSVAENFLPDPQKEKKSTWVLLTINVNTSTPSTPYANISELSDFPGEEEFLFSILSIFRIESVKQNTKEPRFYEIELTLVDVNDNDLNKLMKRIESEIQGPTVEYRLASLLLNLNQYTKAEEVFVDLLRKAEKPAEKALLNFRLGQIEANKKRPEISLSYYEKALAIYQEILPKDHPNIATVYNNMGLLDDELKNYKRALENYRKACLIYEKQSEPNHLLLGTCYNNIATASQRLKNFGDALEFYLKAKSSYEALKEKLNPSLAACYSNIAGCYDDLRNHQKAFEYAQKSVDVASKCLLPSDPQLKVYLQNLELMKKKCTQKRS